MIQTDCTCGKEFENEERWINHFPCGPNDGAILALREQYWKLVQENETLSADMEELHAHQDALERLRADLYRRR